MRAGVRLAMTFLMAPLALAGAALLWLSGPSPPKEESMRLPGTKAAVTIFRDPRGVPRITAENADDAYAALGYLHAEDRLWQMEMQRRIGAGRLAEILGPKALPTDRFMRTLGLYRLAEASVAAMMPEVQRALEAYAAGVNAWIAGHAGPLPAEFLLLRYSPEPWTPADTLVWGRLMALQLSGDWTEKLLRSRLTGTLPPDMMADLWPDYGPPPAGHAELDRHLEGNVAEALLAALPPVLAPRLASNIWVVAGSRTASGKPILTNDPHLEFHAPVLWYLASLSAPGLEVAGATVPGVPFHLLGHNRTIAWGCTTTHSDTIDLFVEQADGDGYLTPEGRRPFAVHTEVITVAGATPVTMQVRQTRHGPVISDILGERAQGRILAFSATALEPRQLSAQAMWRVSRAATWQEFNAALSDFDAPQQNFAYADTAGHIGMVSPGRVPVRRTATGGFPRPGWTGEYDWTGWVPFDELPRQFDPPSGIIVNANDKVVPDGYPWLLAASWPETYRARRIRQRLEHGAPRTPDDMAELQLDRLSLMAVELKPLMLAALPPEVADGPAAAMLAAWDGSMAPERPEPLIFQTWINHLQRALMAPWVGEQLHALSQVRPRFLKAVLSGRSVWCGDAGCAAVVGKALDEALDDISRQYGGSGWRWDKAHRARFDALLFSYIPLLGPMTRLSAAVGGDDFTVNRGSYVMDGPAVFRQVHGAGLRAVYDLADLDSSRFVIATGQSGNPLSSHWGDFLELWQQGKTISLK